MAQSQSNDDKFVELLSIVPSAVSILFFNKPIGKCVHKIIDEDYETLDEVLSDLREPDESDILQTVTKTIHVDTNVEYKWDKTKDEGKLHTFLMKIFEDHKTALNDLFEQISFAVEDCTRDRIQIIASHVVKTINITAKRMKIDDKKLQTLITTENINGKYMKEIKIKTFISKARVNGIPAGKARTLCAQIQAYLNNSKPVQGYSPKKAVHFEEQKHIEEKVEETPKTLSWKDINAIEDFGNEHIVYIVEKYIFDDIKTNTNLELFNENKNKIIECLQTNGFNGKQFTVIKRKVFVDAISEYCKTKKLRGICGKLLKGIKEFDTKRISDMTNSDDGDTQHPAINGDKERKDDIVEMKPRLNWNDVSAVDACNHEHIVHIVDKYALDDVKFDVLNEHREKIIECIQTKKIDGKQLKSMGRKEFGKTMHGFCNNRKINAPSLKLYSALISFDIKRIPTEVSIADYNGNDIPQGHNGHNGPNISTYCVNGAHECNVYELAYLLEHHIFEEIQHAALSARKHKIISYFKENNIDGTMAMGMVRKQFINGIGEYCNDTKVRGAAVKLYNAFHGKVDVSKYPIPSTIKDGGTVERHLKSLTLEECSNEQIIYVLYNHIFKELKSAKLSENKCEIIKYIKTEGMTGKDIANMRAKDFGSVISEYCHDTSLVLSLINELHVGITNFNYSVVPECINASKLPCPTTIDECSITQLLYIINKDIIPNTDKLTLLEPHKDYITSYLTKNNINGSVFLNMNRKTFIHDIMAQSNQQIKKASAVILCNKIKNYKFAISLTHLEPKKSHLERNNQRNKPHVEANKIHLDPNQSPLQSQTSELHLESATATSTLIPRNVLPPVDSEAPMDIPTHLLSEAKSMKPIEKLAAAPFIDYTSSIDSVSAYEHLTCDVVASIAKDHATEAMFMTHKKIQRSIHKYKVNGDMFVKTFDINDGRKFISFFNQKICGGKASRNQRFKTFRKWLIDEIKQMDDNDESIKEYDVAEITKFILDGYDEFISNIFKLESIDGREFMDRGSNDIASDITDKYAIPRGGIAALCDSMEAKLKTDVAQYKKKRSKLKKWTSRKSVRKLSKIDSWDEEIGECIYVLGDIIDALNKGMVGNRIYKKSVIECIESRNINRKRLNNIKESEWLQMMASCDVDKSTGIVMFTRLKILVFEWKRDIATTDECTNEELLYVLLKYVVPSNDKFHEHTDNIIKYLKDKDLNGAKLRSLGKQTFQAEMKESYNVRRGPAGAVYKALIDFKHNVTQSFMV